MVVVLGVAVVVTVICSLNRPVPSGGPLSAGHLLLDDNYEESSASDAVHIDAGLLAATESTGRLDRMELLSGIWPPRPPSPHATLVVVPGMRQTAAITRNVAQNLWRMGQVSFACVVFLYEPEQSISLDNSTSVAQACTVMRWVGRNIVDYMKLLGADVTRGFGGGVLVCMQDRVAQVTHPTIRPGRALRRRLATTV